MKTMIKYRGGKSKEIDRIMWYIPAFKGRYVEPFLGGGALYFYLEPASAIINDINTKLIDFYRGVRNDYFSLRRELDEIEKLYSDNRHEFEMLKSKNPNERVEDKNEELYYYLRDMFNGVKEKIYSDALLYYYINKTAYSGMIRYNSKGEFNVPFGRYKSINTNLVTLSHNKLLQKADIYNTDYSEIFNLCKSDDFIFLDPPYDCTFSDYGNVKYKDGFNEEDHKRLANDFINLPCKSLMVIGKTSLTESLYKNYIVDEYDKNYAVNIRNRFKASAKHIIVANYKRLWDKASYSPIVEYSRDNTCSQLRFFEATLHYGKS